MQTVTVDGPGWSYDLVIGRGALEASADRLQAALQKPSAIVADEAVWSQHHAALQKTVPGLPVITVPPGEASKSWAELERVTEALLAAGVERGGGVVAFGGGVTGDLAGFCASILRRGCQLVQIPTTLLAQVDSSVGGKTAINSAAGKNLVGAFHQPALVVIDHQFLDTLPDREFLAGYAEVIKTAALGDARFFSWLEEHGHKVLERADHALAQAIATCCAAKARIVSEDEKEHGRRALLNLGHTFGHAIEAEGGYDGRVLHGEAVGLGLAMAARFSLATEQCDHDTAARLQALVQASGLKSKLADFIEIPASPERLLAHMRQDKKVEDGTLTLILMKKIGEAFIAKRQDEAQILDFLKEEAQL